LSDDAKQSRKMGTKMDYLSSLRCIIRRATKKTEYWLLSNACETVVFLLGKKSDDFNSGWGVGYGVWGCGIRVWVEVGDGCVVCGAVGGCVWWGWVGTTISNVGGKRRYQILEKKQCYHILGVRGWWCVWWCVWWSVWRGSDEIQSRRKNDDTDITSSGKTTISKRTEKNIFGVFTVNQNLMTVFLCLPSPYKEGADLKIIFWTL